MQSGIHASLKFLISQVALHTGEVAKTAARLSSNLSQVDHRTVRVVVTECEEFTSTCILRSFKLIEIRVS